eukprot:TRINITY_DN39293_c0_g1_i1.p1 TRINITY_DN39293_c0_g1~~TRINITY_DN39293_c0_g1_i1.p1  ORF type:complete len:362 (+),score=65.94 TRINITY_DN39293_c0_g1_i1:71-1087(+)
MAAFARRLASSPGLMARRFVNSQAISNVEDGLKQLSVDGYAHMRLGTNASIMELESVARKLMGLGEVGGGSYNGGGGVSREGIGDSSFLNGSAGAPSELPVQFHNEMAYSANVPKHLAFAMLTQAGEGGTTTLADNVQVTAMFSDALKAKLKAKGVRYIRNLLSEAEKDAPDYFMSWQGAFQTKNVDEAMEKANNKTSVLRHHSDGRHLIHTTWCPVFETHPVLGELYFSSILNRHGSWLDGHSVFGKIPLTERPYHCVWGDGAEFSEEEIKEIRRVHEESTIYVHMDKGDVIVMDNLRVAHGRTAYKGDRLIGLLLSDMVQRPSFQPVQEFVNLTTE